MFHASFRPHLYRKVPTPWLPPSVIYLSLPLASPSIPYPTSCPFSCISSSHLLPEPSSVSPSLVSHWIIFWVASFSNSICYFQSWCSPLFFIYTHSLSLLFFSLLLLPSPLSSLPPNPSLLPPPGLPQQDGPAPRAPALLWSWHECPECLGQHTTPCVCRQQPGRLCPRPAVPRMQQECYKLCQSDTLPGKRWYLSPLVDCAL